jgi:hypothetical protein
MMEAISISETSVYFYETARHYPRKMSYSNSPQREPEISLLENTYLQDQDDRDASRRILWKVGCEDGSWIELAERSVQLRVLLAVLTS